MGLQERIVFATRGRSIDPDRVCAERIAHAFDIDFVHRPYGEEDVSPEQFEDNGKWIAGVRWLDDAAFRMSVPRSGFTVLTGGLGETFRNFYCESYYYKKGKQKDYFELPMTEVIAREHFKAFAQKTNYLAPGLARDFENAFVEQLLSHGGTVGSALFHQYQSFRNRLHYGGATVARARYFRSLDPLYTVAGYELAQRMDPEWQLFGELSFEVIDALFPALNSFPLAEKEVAPRFAESARERAFIRGRKPMTGLRARAPISNTDRFPRLSPPSTDVSKQYITGAMDALGGVFALDRIRAVFADPDASPAISMRKALASPAMFLRTATRP